MHRATTCVVLCGLVLLAVYPTCWAHEPDTLQPSDVSPGRSQIRIHEQDGDRIITSNDIPNHKVGQFPNRGNPNSIRPQQYRFRVTLHPKVNERPTPVQPNLFGVAVNGVVFDPGTAEFWNNDPRSGWNYDALSGKINLGLDDNHAHVQPSGAYHYHGIPTGLIRQLGGEHQVVLVGWAADGFPIYGPWGYARADDAHSSLKELHSSYRLKPGIRQGGPGGAPDGTFVQDWQYARGAGDLDECNGRYGVTPEFPNGTYYYVLTSDFPFVPRYWRGTPDDSFIKQRPGVGGRRGPGGPGRGPSDRFGPRPHGGPPPMREPGPGIRPMPPPPPPDQ